MLRRLIWLLVLILGIPLSGCQPLHAPSAGAQVAALPALPPGELPLREAIPFLEPQAVWANFYALTQTPRSSHHEAQVSAFLAQFGQDLGLETIVDEVGNVLIRKPASAGMEKRQGVVLQAHMDMVAQKTAESMHNFETDPIDAYIEDGWVKAHGTTLGADDGSGVATIMALLQAQDIAHGPLEAIFTVDEEDGFAGVYGLQPGVLQGSILINVDSEEEGVFTIGSAGGAYVDANAPYVEEAADPSLVGYRVAVSGLTGGHSGLDINRNRGNANLLLVRLLWLGEQQFELRVASIAGGDRYNAIPRAAEAHVALPADQAEAFVAFVADYAEMVQTEFAATEPELDVEAQPADPPALLMPLERQSALLDALYAAPNGAMRMSDAVPGLVETSTNLGILQAADGALHAGHYVRSAVDSERDELAQRLESIFSLGGAEAATSNVFSGWPPNPASPILALMQTIYQDLYGREAKLVALHAGLETSVIGATYPQMDMISVGPTLLAVHSPDERMEAASVPMVYDLLVATLAQIP